MYSSPTTHHRVSTRRALIALLALDITLSFAYGFVPADITVLRRSIDVVQFIAMAATMVVALRGVIDSF